MWKCYVTDFDMYVLGSSISTTTQYFDTLLCCERFKNVWFMELRNFDVRVEFQVLKC